MLLLLVLLRVLNDAIYLIKKTVGNFSGGFSDTMYDK